MKVHKAFDLFARTTAWYAGHPATFTVAIASVMIWAALGPTYRYSDTWQLVINTATSVITFLMVFVIQNSQNRESVAIETKLDELIRAVQGAHNDMIGLEDLSQKELAQVHERFSRLAEQARSRLSATNE